MCISSCEVSEPVTARTYLILVPTLQGIKGMEALTHFLQITQVVIHQKECTVWQCIYDLKSMMPIAGREDGNL